MRRYLVRSLLGLVLASSLSAGAKSLIQAHEPGFVPVGERGNHAAAAAVDASTARVRAEQQRRAEQAEVEQFVLRVQFAERRRSPSRQAGTPAGAALTEVAASGTRLRGYATVAQAGRGSAVRPGASYPKASVQLAGTTYCVVFPGTAPRGADAASLRPRMARAASPSARQLVKVARHGSGAYFPGACR